MTQRCTNPMNPEWKNYGGRGVIVCDRWTTFANFLADMGERPAGMTIERRDRGRGYEPGNCIWATALVQARNTRRNVLTVESAREAHRLIGMGASVADVAAVLGATYSAVRSLKIGRTWLQAQL